MTAKYQDWLAANVLSDEKHVTYRVLSHALEVHSNVAKQMLFEFHKTQNARKPSSVHATYLIAGIRKPTTEVTNGHGGGGGGDTAMADSSFITSSMPESEAAEPAVIKVSTIRLVKEKDLEKAKSQYESISTIYIYALSPGDIADFQALTECNKRVHAESVGVDALEAWKTFGTIRNPLAKRRTTQTPVAPLPATAAPSKATNSQTPPSSNASSSQPASQTTTKKPPAAKRESSSLFKSFGKTAASNAKLKLNTPADGASDDEKGADAMEEDASNPEEQAKQRAKAEAAAKEKAAKDAKLRAMMEAEEEEKDEEDDKDEDEVMAEAWSESEPETSQPPPPAAPESQEQNVTTTNGRRRGRRRVMRKKTTTDDEGFLVTREEATWESFSEDEGPSVKSATSSKNNSQTTASQSSVKSETTGKKGQAKKGQGSIMNFFKK